VRPLLPADDDAAVWSRRATLCRPPPAAVGALALLATGEEVNLLTPDLTMPTTTGITVIKEARRHRPSPPAILLTGVGDCTSELALA
jgi:CheY-like chemotaxis protein